MSVYCFGPFRLDRERLLLTLGAEPVAFGPKVVETLRAFVERPGETLTKDELLDRIWPEGFVEEGNLAQNVYVIRKVLRAHWTDIIQTVPRCGYRFAGDVVRLAAGGAVRRKGASRLSYAAAAAALALGVTFGLRHDTARSRPAMQQLSARGARLYAMGNYYWKQRTQSGVQKSIRYFKAVLASDPKNARGYAALAEGYAIEGNYGYGPLRSSQSYKSREILRGKR